MLSFHGDPAIKARYVARVTAHEAADEIIHGVYWEDGKGCAVGCILHKGAGEDVHRAYETELGIPEWLARLEDLLFECMPAELAKTFPRRFLESIPVGVELDLVGHRFFHWLLVDSEHGVIQYAGDDEEVRSAILAVADLHHQAAESAAWSAAWSAAESAAWSAAESAARSAAESAARSAAWSAARSAAESAAWSAAESAARSAAWSARNGVMAEALLGLLADATPVAIAL